MLLHMQSLHVAALEEVALNALAASPPPLLTDLAFSCSIMAPQPLAILAPCLTQLRSLGLFGPLHGTSLAPLSALSGLEALALVTDAWIGMDQASDLAAAPLPGLRHLRIRASRVERFTQVVRGPWFAHLEGLHIDDSAQGDTLAFFWSNCPTQLQLRSLGLRRSRLTDTGLSLLVAASWLTGLTRLDLGKNNHGLGVQSKAWLAFATTPMPELKVLDLGGMRLKDSGPAVALGMAPWLSGLQELKLRDSKFTQLLEGVPAFIHLRQRGRVVFNGTDTGTDDENEVEDEDE